MKLVVAFFIACLSLPSCTADEEAEASDTWQFDTTTVPLSDDVAPDSATPSDFSNPSMLFELQGLTLSEAEQRARDRGWTTIESYTAEAYWSTDFDADFRQTRIRFVYAAESAVVLEAIVG